MPRETHKFIWQLYVDNKSNNIELSHRLNLKKMKK